MEGAGDDIRSITRPHTPKLMGRTQASWFWFFLFFLSFFHLRTDTDGYYWRIEWESSPFADVVRQRSYDGQLKRKWKPWAVNESTKWGCVTSRVTWSPLHSDKQYGPVRARRTVFFLCLVRSFFSVPFAFVSSFYGFFLFTGECGICVLLAFRNRSLEWRAVSLFSFYSLADSIFRYLQSVH